MSLSTKKTITIEGQSMIDGVIAEGYRAVINSASPSEVNFSSWQQNKTLYKENRVQCRADRAEFEDMVYALQSEMTGTTEETEDDTAEETAAE